MPNFKKFGEVLDIFEFLRQKTSFFGRCGTTLLMGAFISKKYLHFWNKHENLCMLRNGYEFLTSSGPPKRTKTPKKCPLYHFLATQEEVLGDCIFGGENGHQIKMFKLS